METNITKPYAIDGIMIPANDSWECGHFFSSIYSHDCTEESCAELTEEEKNAKVQDMKDSIKSNDPLCELKRYYIETYSQDALCVMSTLAHKLIELDDLDGAYERLLKLSRKGVAYEGERETCLKLLQDLVEHFSRPVHLIEISAVDAEKCQFDNVPQHDTPSDISDGLGILYISNLQQVQDPDQMQWIIWALNNERKLGRNAYSGNYLPCNWIVVISANPHTPREKEVTRLALHYPLNIARCINWLGSITHA